MRIFSFENQLIAAAALLVALSLDSLLAVAERATSALWQWYKFSGYEAAGIITMSRETGIWFAAISLGMIASSFVIKHLSIQKGVPIGARFSKLALLIFCASLLMYCMVALSPLNEWRP